MPIAIKMAGKEIASYDTTTDKVAIKLSDDVSIKDSAGNVVLGNSGLTSNVDMSNVDMSNVVFPTGHVIQYLTFGSTLNGQNTSSPYYYYGGNAGSTSATGTPFGQITLKQSNAKLFIIWTSVLATGSHNTGEQNNITSFVRYSTNNDLSSATEKQLFYEYQDMRAQGDLPQQTIVTKSGRVAVTLSNSANDIYYFGMKDTKYGWNAGWAGNYGEGSILEIIEIQQ
jgi:hypothetical protein